MNFATPYYQAIKAYYDKRYVSHTDSNCITVILSYLLGREEYIICW